MDYAHLIFSLMVNHKHNFIRHKIFPIFLLSSVRWYAEGGSGEIKKGIKRNAHRPFPEKQSFH